MHRRFPQGAIGVARRVMQQAFGVDFANFCKGLPEHGNLTNIRQLGADQGQFAIGDRGADIFLGGFELLVRTARHKGATPNLGHHVTCIRQ